MSEQISDKIDIQDVINAGIDFIQSMKDENARYVSWEHCYKQFTKYKIKKVYKDKKAKKDLTDADYDTLALHLAFYLASWGMYRGSSFLLQQDYKVHTEAVRVIMNEEYNSLWYKDDDTYFTNYGEKLETLKTLVKALEDIYSPIRDNAFKLIKKECKSKSISPILITKILMGTIGCTPAYDRFFIDSMKKYKIASHIFISKEGLQSMQQLAKYYIDNIARFKKLQEEINKERNMIYPPMKILDMCFWQLSFKESQPKK
ncbi:hypothetical protein PVA45_08610 (plasmid) [Entomospira entomophila]|uniref:Uncharacterized protein n=1 Tax=Entomospira entomophila TaxID=2719988 RepID=A0A968GFN1_9SPIO|nr:hypothetical protein [Entomospira entomophilus]NIZ41569.1 hypothetical protein [Entomospira entomophilus]WDI36454.1 hypothetical protein PVA45_08610 [Entomospira entomophilus]